MDTNPQTRQIQKTGEPNWIKLVVNKDDQEPIHHHKSWDKRKTKAERGENSNQACERRATKGDKWKRSETERSQAGRQIQTQNRDTVKVKQVDKAANQGGGDAANTHES